MQKPGLHQHVETHGVRLRDTRPTMACVRPQRKSMNGIHLTGVYFQDAYQKSRIRHSMWDVHRGNAPI